MTEVKLPTFLVDLITLGTGGIILLIFFTVVTPSRRGIYCGDESINYPFISSTIPNWLLYVFGFSIPFVVIIGSEFFLNRKNRDSGTFLTRPAPAWFLHMYRNLVDFMFGCVASQLVTDVGKYTIGRLRPNFIAVCNPNIDFSNCGIYNHSYILNYKCLSSDDDAKESRVSFPSGHASFSTYTMLYVAIYIHMKWVVNERSIWRLFKCGVQLAVILLAYFTALSRVMDNKHHWSDVTAGALIGAISASLTSRYISQLMSGNRSSCCYTETSAVSHDLNNMESGTQSGDITSNVKMSSGGKRPGSQQSHHQQQSVANPRSSYDSSAVLR